MLLRKNETAGIAVTESKAPTVIKATRCWRKQAQGSTDKMKKPEIDSHSTTK